MRRSVSCFFLKYEAKIEVCYVHFEYTFEKTSAFNLGDQFKKRFKVAILNFWDPFSFVFWLMIHLLYFLATDKCFFAQRMRALLNLLYAFNLKKIKVPVFYAEHSTIEPFLPKKA